MNSIYNYLIGLTLDLNNTLVAFNQTATQLSILKETSETLSTQITEINNLTNDLGTQLSNMKDIQNDINTKLENTSTQLSAIETEIKKVENYTNTLTELTTFVYNTDVSSGINTVITNNYMLTSLNDILDMKYNDNYELISLNINTMLSDAINRRPNPQYSELTVTNLSVMTALNLVNKATIIGLEAENIIGDIKMLTIDNLTVLDSLKANNVELTSLTLLTDVIHYTSDGTVIM